MFKHEPRRVADESIVMAEMLPGRVESRGAGVGSVTRLQLMAQSAQRRVGFILWCRFRRWSISQPIESRRCATTAQGKVHGAVVRIDHEIRDRQRRTG